MNEGHAKVRPCCGEGYALYGRLHVGVILRHESWRYRTPLVVIDRNLTARRYIAEVSQPLVLPFFRNRVNITLYHQDNARPHPARWTT